MDENKNVSVTVVIPAEQRDWLVRLAEATGHNRTHPVTGESGGNLSWGIQEAVGYLIRHREQYINESRARLMEDLEGAGDE